MILTFSGLQTVVFLRPLCPNCLTPWGVFGTVVGPQQQREGEVTVDNDDIEEEESLEAQRRRRKDTEDKPLNLLRRGWRREQRDRCNRFFSLSLQKVCWVVVICVLYFLFLFFLYFMSPCVYYLSIESQFMKVLPENIKIYFIAEREFNRKQMLWLTKVQLEYFPDADRDSGRTARRMDGCHNGALGVPLLDNEWDISWGGFQGTTTQDRPGFAGWLDKRLSCQ